MPAETAACPYCGTPTFVNVPKGEKIVDVKKEKGSFWTRQAGMKDAGSPCPHTFYIVTMK